MNRFRSKKTVDSYPHLDVRRWQRHGLLSPGRSFTWSGGFTAEERLNVTVEETHCLLRYRDRKLGKIHESIAVEWTECNYGGRRPWFRCPGLGSRQPCHRRVALLYKIHSYFLCRVCQGLAYKSQQLDRVARLERKARKIYRRLGAPGDLDALVSSKPKRMHWRTYSRLLRQAIVTQRALLDGKKKQLWQRPRKTRGLIARLAKLLSA